MSATSGSIRVKFLARGNTDCAIWLRQFPASMPKWGDCEFIFDPEAGDYDWLVVYDDLPAPSGRRFSYTIEALGCPPHNTVLVTTEPSAIRHYGRHFLRQFGHVITSQEPEIINHPGAIYTQPGLRWFYGAGKHKFISYDEMLADDVRDKPRLLSTVCSAKRQRHTANSQRYEFTQYVAKEIPQLSLYGHGVRPVNDKAEAIRPYRYHLAIENYFCRHHITEKLMDAFLGGALPLYAGCPNAADYFAAESFIPLDLSDFERSADIIRNAIENNEYEKRLPAILRAREKVLNEYNLFAVISHHIEALSNTDRPDVVIALTHGRKYIKSRRAIWKKNPIAWLESFYYKAKNRTRRLDV